MQSNALRVSDSNEMPTRSREYKEYPRHCRFPLIINQVMAHKHDYNELKVEPFIRFVEEGNWSASALPEGADGWLVGVANSGHYVVDVATAKRKLAIRRPMHDRTITLPMDLQRIGLAKEAFAHLRQLQPFDLYVVAVQLGRTELGGLSVEQRINRRHANEIPMGVREISDVLRIMSRLESPQDLGIYCSADRFGADIVPCFSFENRALKLSSRSVGSPDSSFAEATWFMPQQ